MPGMDTEPLPRTAGRRLGGVALFGLWAAAAAVSVGVGFGAVHLVGREVVDETPRQLSTDVAAPGPEASTTAPSSTRSASAGPAPTRTAAAPAPRVRSFTVTGGTVGVSCRGSAISLVFATPRNGYTMDKGHRGPREVEVEFEGPDGKGRFKAECSGSSPVIRLR
jgi:hypothetical protein